MRGINTCSKAALEQELEFILHIFRVPQKLMLLVFRAQQAANFEPKMLFLAIFLRKTVEHWNFILVFFVLLSTQFLPYWWMKMCDVTVSLCKKKSQRKSLPNTKISPLPKKDHWLCRHLFFFFSMMCPLKYLMVIPNVCQTNKVF